MVVVTRCPECSTMVVESMEECPVCHRALDGGTDVPAGGATAKPSGVGQWSANVPGVAGTAPVGGPGAGSADRAVGAPDGVGFGPGPSSVEAAAVGAGAPADAGLDPGVADGGGDAGLQAGRGGAGSHRGRNIAAAVSGVVVVLVLVAAGLFVVKGRGGGSKALAVTLVPIGNPGPDPFTGSVVKVDTKTAKAYRAKAARSSSTRAQSSPTSGAASGRLRLTRTAGDKGGFYGVDPKTPVADGSRLAAELAAKPTAAAAWATMMGVEPSAIQSTVKKLTPVLLGADTAVTSHALRRGNPHAYQAVLQAGTPVFIDAHGTPVVAAASGNPLTEPDLSGGDVTVQGHVWHGFDRDDVTQVTASDKPLTTIDGTDVQTGKPVTVGVGSTISLDGYLVSNDKGVSVVSFDGKKTTQIIDHPVAKVFDDGAGGIVYQDRSSHADQYPDIDPTTIMRYRAAEKKPVVMASAKPGQELQLLYVGSYHGAMTAMIADSDAPPAGVTSGPQSNPIFTAIELIDLATAKVHRISFDVNHARAEGTVILGGAIGGDRGAVNTRGWTRSYDWGFFGNPKGDGSGPGEYCRGPSSNVCLGDSGVVLSDGSLATVNATLPDESVTVNVGPALPNKPTRTLRIDEFDAQDSGAYVLGYADHTLTVSFTPNPNDNSTPQNAVAIDTETWQTKAVPVTGQVSPLWAPIIRPVGDNGGSASSTTSSATTAAAPTTAVPTTGPPPTQPATTTTAPGAPCPTGAELEAAVRAGDPEDAPNLVSGSGQVLGCSGAWAYGAADSRQPGATGPDGTPMAYTWSVVLRLVGGHWTFVDRRTPCETHEIPPTIYQGACNSN